MGGCNSHRQRRSVARRDASSSRTSITVDDAVAAVYQWNDRKRAFEPRQIRLAWDVLGAGGWLRTEPAPARERR